MALPQLLPRLALECGRKARSNLELMHTKRGSPRKLTQNHQYKSWDRSKCLFGTRQEITHFIKHPKYPGSNNSLKLTDTIDHSFFFFWLHNFNVSSLVASSDDHKRAQRNVILMKAQVWPEQDVDDGPGWSWPAGGVKQVPWLPTNTGISENSSFEKSHTERKMGRRGWVWGWSWCSYNCV